MGACLGIYLGDKIIKYAKLIRDEKSKRISLNSCGSKYIAGDKEFAIGEIIEQTGSANDSIVLNLSNYSRLDTEVLKQLGKNDMQSVINLEVADYATGLGMNEKAVDYRYLLMDSIKSSDSYTANIAITEKSNIDKFIENRKFSNLVGMYPQEYVLNNLVQTNGSYLIANIDEKTQLISVSNGRMKKIADIDVSMSKILDAIAEQEGSYSKACDLCRSINVLSDENISPNIERIIEPTIQDLLNRIKSKLEEDKIPYARIYLNGLINLFINIDVLFEEFFGITTEKLRPSFLTQDGNENISEIIDASDAIALAYQGLDNSNEDINFVQAVAPKISLGSLFNKKEPKDKNKVSDGTKKKIVVMPNINQEKIEKALVFANLTAGAVLAGYVGLSATYENQMTKLEHDLSEKITALKTETSTITEDTKYINQNTQNYTTFNNYISDTVKKIKEGKIGEYTTYNVANFMQRIARYIPTNVELQTITSDNNKSVSIVAKSNSYAELGYFISQLKLQGVLENIQTSNVVTGKYITVTIGGELP